MSEQKDQSAGAKCRACDEGQTGDHAEPIDCALALHAALYAARATVERLERELEAVRAIWVVHFDKRTVHKLGQRCEAGVCP